MNDLHHFVLSAIEGGQFDFVTKKIRFSMADNDGPTYGDDSGLWDRKSLGIPLGT